MRLAASGRESRGGEEEHGEEKKRKRNEGPGCLAPCLISLKCLKKINK